MINLIKSEKIFKSLNYSIILSAILFRFWILLQNRSLWHDEASLALNIQNLDFISLWGVLEHLQSAPPLFLSVSKMFYNFITPPEFALRLFPFIAGSFAIYLFFILLNKIFQNKILITVGNFLFAFNFQLIYYSQEFKQYSVDVCMLLLALYLFYNFDLKTAKLKSCFFLALCCVILPFISLSTVFVMISFGIYNLFNSNFKKNMQLIVLFLPSLLCFCCYYFMTLKPSQNLMLQTFSDMWHSGFLNFDLNNIFALIKTNLIFYFSSVNYWFFQALLMVLGLFFLVKRHLKLDLLLILTFLSIIIFSFLHLYPIKERVSLFIIPIILFFILASLEVLKNKVITVVLSIIFILCFESYSFNHIFNYPKHSLFYREDASRMMMILKEQYKLGEIIIYNDFSDSEFEFYGNYYKFLTPKVIYGKLSTIKYDEFWYKTVLNSLPKDHKYWFYYVYDKTSQPVIPFLKDWLVDKIVLQEYESKGSYLVLVENI